MQTPIPHNVVVFEAAKRRRDAARVRAARLYRKEQRVRRRKDSVAAA